MASLTEQPATEGERVHRVTRRMRFSMCRYLERLLRESDISGRFPIRVRNNSCDRVSFPACELNLAFERGDHEALKRLRNRFFAALCALEDIEQERK